MSSNSRTFGLIRLFTAAWAVVSTAQAAETVFDLPVRPVSSPPVIDGELDDWGNDGWSAIPIHPAVEGDDKNLVGKIVVSGKGLYSGDRVYFAFRWADNKADTVYKDWVWRGNRYRRGKQLDDMFGLRFEMSGDYDSCMLSDKSYDVDVWVWSAGRSALHDYADDMTQQISNRMLENAAEHEGPNGQIVYIKKRRDAGEAGYTNTRPNRRKKTETQLPGIEATEGPTGSLADVSAKGIWKDGHWQLELSRKLDTGNDDDVVLKPGGVHRGAIAVFNRGGAEHKSNSDTLLFNFQQ